MILYLPQKALSLHSAFLAASQIPKGAIGVAGFDFLQSSDHVGLFMPTIVCFGKIPGVQGRLK